MAVKVYNPLDKLNLGKSIQSEIALQPPISLNDVSRIVGAGIYLIYYFGNHPLYSSISEDIANPTFSWPIYVGKAAPKGGGTKGLGNDSSQGNALATRLKKHLTSIVQAHDLSPEDFLVKHLVVDDIWIPLGENMLIESFRPVWNNVVKGFGINDPGEGRNKQKTSMWDILHTGRAVAKNTSANVIPREEIESKVRIFLAEQVRGSVDPR